jgi:Carbohydrate family 9 binding domain-like
MAMLACGSGHGAPQAADQTMPRPEWRDHPPPPREYVALHRDGALAVDGRLDDPAWAKAPWSADFTDIEGDVRPAPRFRTRMKMLYDSVYWYIGAELEEPDLRATIRQRDAVIFHDNDFELFVDPDGDTHRYVELEINALATPWDLFLPVPYRDGGHAVDSFDIAGLLARVALDGTLNDPRDRDRGWTVELAIPWASLADSGRTPVPPRDGDAWRVNFSRVEWDVDTTAGSYTKRLNPATGKPLPEHNWVWSPQGAINMHMPEMWGIVYLGHAAPPDSATRATQWTLRRVYYAQRDYRQRHRRYAEDPVALGMASNARDLVMVTLADGWGASLPAPSGDGRWHIRTDGRLWRE